MTDDTIDLDARFECAKTVANVFVSIASADDVNEHLIVCARQSRSFRCSIYEYSMNMQRNSSDGFTFSALGVQICAFSFFSRLIELARLLWDANNSLFTTQSILMCAPRLGDSDAAVMCSTRTGKVYLSRHRQSVCRHLEHARWNSYSCDQRFVYIDLQVQIARTAASMLDWKIHETQAIFNRQIAILGLIRFD